MAVRQRPPERARAYGMWARARDKGKEPVLTEIAKKLGITSSKLYRWRKEDDWEGKYALSKRGAPKGNRNAAGKHARGPVGNQNAVKHGAYAKLMADRMTDEERQAYADEGYSSNVLEAIRLEVRTINVQQLRLMTRLAYVRDQLEDIADPEEARNLRRELDAIENGLDRASGRKTKLLSLLYDADQAEDGHTVSVYFGQMPAPGEAKEGGELDAGAED